MALQSARGRGEPQRRRLFTVRGGYHGDTFGAMSVCDPVGGMHSLFAGVLAEQVFAPRPPAGFHRAPDDPELDRWTQESTALFQRLALLRAAVVAEPVLQVAGGMLVYCPECRRRRRRRGGERG